MNEQLFVKLYPSEPVKALSWREPYASLMLHGKIETRVWDTAYRGWVLICTSLKPYSFESVNNHIAGSHQTNRIFLDVLGTEVFEYDEEKMYAPTLGKAIAIGCLVNTWEMRPQDEDRCFVQYKKPWLETVTSKTTGKTKQVTKRLYCHEYADVMPIKPFEWKGKLGFSNLTEEQKKKIVIL